MLIARDAQGNIAIVKQIFDKFLLQVQCLNTGEIFFVDREVTSMKIFYYEKVNVY